MTARRRNAFLDPAPFASRLPAAVLRRQGLDRAAFCFFVLGLLSLHLMAVANVCLAACLILTLLARGRTPASATLATSASSGVASVGAPIAAFVLLSVLSCFFSTLPSRSLEELKGFSTFLLLPLAFTHLRSEEDAELAVDAWRLLTFYLVVRGVLQWASGMDRLEARVTGGLSAYMTYAGLLLPLVLLLLARGLSPSPRRRRALDLLAAAAGTVALALTYTRSAYLGLALGAVVLLLAFRPRLALLLPAVVAVLLAAMPSAVRQRALSSFDVQDGTALDRISMWKSGAMMVRDRPLFGVGPGRVKELFPVYRRDDSGELHPGHLHDNVLMVAAETGIPSALAYLAFVTAAVVRGLRRAREPVSAHQRALAGGSAAAMVALFVAGLFEYNFGDVEVLRATLVTAALPFVARVEPRSSPSS